MTSSDKMSSPHDRLASSLSAADDRVRLNHWLPPQTGVVPRIRIGQHWINVLWALPLMFVLLVIGVAVAQALRELPAVQDVLARYPGVPHCAVAVDSGFPGWLRLQHFLNLFFMAFIIRADAPYPRPGQADGGSAIRGALLFCRCGDGGRYYDAHSLSNLRHELTILAYEMNGAPVSVLHGAPLRLRCENKVGFKMIKWIAGIGLVHDYADLGAGEGGYNKDHEFYGYRVPI